MIQFINGPGTTKQTAIKIIGANDEKEGIIAMCRFLVLLLSIKRREWKLQAHEMYEEKDKVYDNLVIKEKGG